MKYFFLSLICTISQSCNTQQGTTPKPGKGTDSSPMVHEVRDSTWKNSDSSITAFEDSLFIMISDLTEVAQLRRRIADSAKQKMSIQIARPPDSLFKYYWFQVGIDDSFRFQPIYNFYIDVSHKRIFFYDTISDSLLTLSKWRQRKI